MNIKFQLKVGSWGLKMGTIDMGCLGVSNGNGDLLWVDISIETGNFGCVKSKLRCGIIRVNDSNGLWVCHI